MDESQLNESDRRYIDNARKYSSKNSVITFSALTLLGYIATFYAVGRNNADQAFLAFVVFYLSTCFLVRLFNNRTWLGIIDKLAKK